MEFKFEINNFIVLQLLCTKIIILDFRNGKESITDPKVPVTGYLQKSQFLQVIKSLRESP